MKTIETTKTMAMVRGLISDVKEDVEFLFDRQDYDDMLDECYPEFKLGEMTFYPSDILKNCDPVAYRCGYNDYCDGELEERGTEIVCSDGSLYTLEDIDDCELNN